MLRSMERKLIITCINLQLKNKVDRHDRKSYWSISIKETIQWFPFLSIMDHTSHILEPNISLIPLLLKVFEMFQLLIFYDKKYGKENIFEAIDIKFINCNKETGLYLKDITIE